MGHDRRTSREGEEDNTTRGRSVVTLSHKHHYFRNKKKSYWTQNVRFDFLYNFCL